MSTTTAKKDILATANKLGINHLYHMTELANLESILEHGLFGHENEHQIVDISNSVVNSRRAIKEPIYNKPIHSYVPFYINPRNAMLYSTQKRFGRRVIILGFDVDLLENAVVTDGNAACSGTLFCGSYQFLNELNVENVFATSWYNKHQSSEVKRQMMTEALVPKPVSTQKLKVIYCQDLGVKSAIEKECELGDITVEVNTNYFFENLL